MSTQPSVSEIGEVLRNELLLDEGAFYGMDEATNYRRHPEEVHTSHHSAGIDW